MIEPKSTKPEAVILGNGPSLFAFASRRDQLPLDRLFVIGVNQSWRLFPTADAHVFIDATQYLLRAKDPVEHRENECAAYYDRMAKEGLLFHFNAPGSPGHSLTRHDALSFSRHPFRHRHRGAGSPAPPLSEDGGVALKVENGSGGSTAYVALQIAAAMGFSRIWLVGLDMDAKKFTGERSNSERHDRIWRYVPDDVKAKALVVAPSLTKQLTVVSWPWGEQGEPCCFMTPAEATA